MLFFRKNKSDNSIVNKRAETSVPEFSGILPEFSTNQNFWGCTCLSALHHWMDSAT